MKLEKYEVDSDESFMVFEFVSEGPKGSIIKIVEYSETNLKGFYNIAFGDKDHVTGKMDDGIITDNKDWLKVLATVASTLYVFTDVFPDSWIYAKGNNEVRRRLYRMAISRFIKDFSSEFNVYGLIEGKWEYFRKGKNYEAFLAKRKYLILKK